MKQVTTVAILAVVGVLLIAETSSAQLLRRRWERRKAEIRSEVVSQVTPELNAKLEADLAREMDSATKELKKSTTAQVNAESKRLADEVRAEIAKMREEARKMVAEEAKKIFRRIEDCALFTEEVRKTCETVKRKLIEGAPPSA